MLSTKLPEARYVVGESVIVQDIATDGARILLTKNMQAELALAVTRIDAVAYRQTDYIFIGLMSNRRCRCCCARRELRWPSPVLPPAWAVVAVAAAAVRPRLRVSPSARACAAACAGRVTVR